VPDVYASIAATPIEVQERLADVLETRAADPRQRALWDAYLSQIRFPREAHVLEVGCGTGAITRILAQLPGVTRAHGVDPSPVFIQRARELSQDLPNVTFEESEGGSLALAPASFDVVVMHQVLSHVPHPGQLLTEAHRVLRPRGWVAIFDGDYATATVATGDYDPLEACVHAFRESFIHDAWVMRRLPQLLKSTGFESMAMQSHGYVESPEAGYMLSWIDRGATSLQNAGRIDRVAVEALKAEAHRRNMAKIWFGHIAYASILAQKPA
jgi:ubiquinone/menaquinone biosynthesis C-methylase UbiE